MIYSFDDFEINCSLREVSLGNECLNVEPKVYELIVFFVQNANQAISKNEIQNAIWPSLEVSETAITRAVMKARKVLNNEKNPVDYIQTIHGHGYKFISEVRVYEHESKETIDKSKGPYLLWTLVLLSLVVVGLIYQNKVISQPGRQQLLVLPVVNQVEDQNYSWASLGLMALSSKMIDASNQVWVANETDSIKAAELLASNDLPLSHEKVAEIKEFLSVNYVVGAKLSQKGNEFELAFEVHHPKGIFSGTVLKGSNPTALTQKMAEQITQLLPNAVAQVTHEVISDDIFTNELFSRGMAFQIQGDVDKAENYFQLAIEQDGSLLAPKIQLAVVKRKQNKLEEAKQDLIALLEDLGKRRNPYYHVQVLNALGVTELRLLNNESALLNFKKAYGLAKQQKLSREIVKVTHNMAIIHRRNQELDQARQWAAESLATRQENKLSKTYSITYLIGQIERDSGNIDKALSLFHDAYDGYFNAGEFRNASSVLSAISKMLIKKGMFKRALDVVHKALDQKTLLNDTLGLVDSSIILAEIYVAIGDQFKAREIFEKVKLFANENQVSTRNNYLTKLGISINFKEQNYSQVLNKISLEAKDFKSKNLDMLALKSLQQVGNKDAIKSWLLENKQFKNGSNNMMRMYWFDLENYYLEYHGSYESLLESYKNRMALSRLMGNDALTVTLLLKTGYQQMINGDINQAERTFNEVNSFGLDWFQIKFYEAMLVYFKGNSIQAKNLSDGAKLVAGSAWNDDYEAVSQFILETTTKQKISPKVLF